MFYRLAADSVVAFHLLFILFVLFGGVALLRWRWLVWLHLPAVAWGMAVEFLHLYCPLTPLENRLRQAAGEAGYAGGFIEHYLIPLIYPSGLTPQLQLLFGGVVLLLNLAVYLMLLRRTVRLRRGLAG
ncbi:MAG: DUF2784 domain-containing protein [Pseudomonas sp.]|uniref:DUF2784 domain-containing protein n=1 Tax=Pseudomonas sp. TaxID=306 RepID=UPI0033933BCC